MIPLRRFLLRSFPLFVLLFAFRAIAETTWTEVKSPHFRVLTDGGTGQGREVASDFEQMRHVFAVWFNDPNIGASAPLTIIAARDEDTFKMLEPSAWKATKGNLGGLFHSGWEKQFAIIRLDMPEASGRAAVFHEYAHSILHSRARWLPTWLDEGMAEFYGYTRFESHRTLVGVPSLKSPILREMTPLPAEEMLTTRTTSKLMSDPRRAELFYAESWAMVHFMMYGPGMESGAKLNAFFHKIQTGETQKQAFEENFGDFKAFDNTFRQYTGNFTFRASVIPADEKVDASSFSIRKLNPAETEYELGSYQIGVHETVLGRARIEKALVLDPKLAGAHEELAFLEFRAGKDDEAVKEWQTAIDSDPTRGRSAFALVMSGTPVKSQSRQELFLTRANLDHVIDLAPNFAPAYVERALVNWRLGLINPAYQDAAKAEQLEPFRAGYGVLSGRILLAGNQPALAAKHARFVAERWSGPDHNEAVDLWNDVPPGSRDDGAPLAPELPPDTKVIRGNLTELTCATAPQQPMIVTVTPDESASQPITFKSDGRMFIGFSDSFWWGEDHFNLCHHLTGHPVVIAYKPQDNHLLDLEVRDDLPLPAKAAVVPTVAAK